MDDIIVWTIIAAFYAPLHYLLPVLILFITGSEPETERRQLIRRALIDSTLSMIAAFGVVIALANSGRMMPAMLILLASMAYPLLRIWQRRDRLQSSG